jgi:hypothetical protein
MLGELGGAHHPELPVLELQGVVLVGLPAGMDGEHVYVRA